MKYMKTHFLNLLEDTTRTLDDTRCQIEETIMEHDLLPGKIIHETADNIVVKVMVPGIKKKNLNLNVTESQITVEASFKLENDMDGPIFSLKDNKAGTLKRRIKLPKKVNPQEATAKLENGILKIEIPKLEKDEEFKIEIE